MEDTNIADSDTPTDEVEVDLHMLVLHEINGEVDRANVVIVDECGAHEGTPGVVNGATIHSTMLLPIVSSLDLTLEREMIGCRFEDQKMRLAPRNMT